MATTRLKEAMEGIGKHKPLTREEKKELARDQVQRVLAYTTKLNEISETKSISPQEFKKLFSMRFEQITGHPVKVDEENMDVIGFLLLYFTGSNLIDRYKETFGFDGKIQAMSLNKGIMLLGCPGSGKTSILQALSYNQRNPFSVVSCVEIASKFSRGGYDEVDQYMKINKNPSVRPFGNSEIGWMFDDLGYEKATKHYGDEALIMEEILFSHSNNPESKGKIHVSSNYTIEEIRERYGSRIASRIYQMFNVIYYRSETDRRI